MRSKHGFVVWFPLVLSQVPSTLLMKGIMVAPSKNAAQRNTTQHQVQHNAIASITQAAQRSTTQHNKMFGVAQRNIDYHTHAKQRTITQRDKVHEKNTRPLHDAAQCNITQLLVQHNATRRMTDNGPTQHNATPGMTQRNTGALSATMPPVFSHQSPLLSSVVCFSPSTSLARYFFNFPRR